MLLGSVRPALTLQQSYEAVLAVGCDIVDHLPYFVELCVERDAKQVIELGVRSGNSTIAWLYGLEQTGGELWSVDIDPAPPIEADRWFFIRASDLDVAGSLPDDVDIVFIDTLHYYEHTLAELELYVPKVKPGGVVVMHDTELNQSYFPPEFRTHEFPVKSAVTEFCAAHGLVWENRTNCFGLATIHIPEV